ncbi:MAG: ABC transporter permease subunit [Pirellulales bacterium]|nr:ABC transporter permease subunit [Pirellulales bacterium]
MNRALWFKSIREARLLLLSCAVLMFIFNWIFVWVTSLVDLSALRIFLKALPPEMQNLSGVSVDEVATYSGRIALAYVDPVVLMVAAVWAISRGSDAVSGEINRGTMELLIAQPVRRFTVLWTQATVTIVGGMLIAASCLLGTAMGLWTIEFDEPIKAATFIPAATNIFGLIFFLAGTSTLASSWESYRWRTVGLMGGVFIIGLIIKVMARTVSKLDWLAYFTFFGAFEPQAMVSNTDRAWELVLRYNSLLLGMGLAAYIAATVIFCRRDLPAPL